jgi:hypothetical protein
MRGLKIAFLFTILLIAFGAKSKPSAAIPKSKKNKKSMFSFNIVNKMIREAKISFCSELEALTLQVKPLLFKFFI